MLDRIASRFPALTVPSDPTYSLALLVLGLGSAGNRYDAQEEAYQRLTSRRVINPRQAQHLICLRDPLEVQQVLAMLVEESTPEHGENDAALDQCAGTAGGKNMIPLQIK